MKLTIYLLNFMRTIPDSSVPFKARSLEDTTKHLPVPHEDSVRQQREVGGREEGLT